MSTTKCFCNISKTTLTLLSILGFLLFVGEQMWSFIHTQNIRWCSCVSIKSSNLVWICKDVCVASSIIKYSQRHFFTAKIFQDIKEQKKEFIITRQRRCLYSLQLLVASNLACSHSLFVVPLS